jgi:hypothetical protein
MSPLAFSVLGARVDPYAAAPTIVFRLRIEDAEDRRIHAMTLRGQVKIEPRKRHYTDAEQRDLYELFDVPRRWGETLQTMLWLNTSLTVQGFTGHTEVDVPIACTYDFDVTATKYFQALEGGDIPLLFLWSGTLFVRAENGFLVEPIPWDRETPFRLPVATWRETIDRHFPGTAWLRLRRDLVEALHRFKARRGLTSWDDALGTLLAASGEDERAGGDEGSPFARPAAERGADDGRHPEAVIGALAGRRPGGSGS